MGARTAYRQLGHRDVLDEWEPPSGSQTFEVAAYIGTNWVSPNSTATASHTISGTIALSRRRGTAKVSRKGAVADGRPEERRRSEELTVGFSERPVCSRKPLNRSFGPGSPRSLKPEPGFTSEKRVFSELWSRAFGARHSTTSQPPAWENAPTAGFGLILAVPDLGLLALLRWVGVTAERVKVS